MSLLELRVKVVLNGPGSANVIPRALAVRKPNAHQWVALHVVVPLGDRDEVLRAVNRDP